MEDSKTNPIVEKTEASTAGESSTLEICGSAGEKKKVLGVKQAKETSEQIRGSTEGKDIAGKKKKVEIERGEPEASRNNPEDGDGAARDNEGTKSSIWVKKPEVVKIEEDEDDLEREDEIDAPEVGIVGPPTAVRDLVNEEELGTTESSSLPSDNRNENRETSGNNGGAPDVAEWIERSRRSNDDELEETGTSDAKTSTRRRKKSFSDCNASGGPTRKSQRIVTSIIRRSIKCLNKMHAAVEYGSCGTGKKLETEKRQEESRESPKVAQSRQNGAALPEEAATAVATSGRGASERLCPTIKCENQSDGETERQSMEIDSARPRRCSADETKEKKIDQTERGKAGREKTRKRRSTDTNFAGNPFAKKICFEERERFIEYLVGTTDRVSAEELASRADQLRAQVQALDELARAKEMEWNEILSMRKLKEEAYLRIERRRQVVGYMESGSNGQVPENVPPASLSLVSEWESPLQPENSEVKETSVEEPRSEECQQRVEESRQVTVPPKRDKINAQRRAALPKRTSENGRKTQQVAEQQSLENRQIGEGRQGPIVDVRSIIADYRLRHPETVPRRYDKKPECPARPRETLNQTSGLINVRRGRRMRNSVNIGLGAGGAMVETGHNADSRPSSTDSCKSNTNASLDPNNSMSFKDVLVQFAKLSQQQGEAVKTPQNYPDVTLHPVTPSPVVPISTASSQQTTGSLLHGILTKSQSPRPTTFSPTLARLLTAPERERNTSGSASTAASSTPQHRVEQTQHLLQAYQGSNPVSISDLLSSSKARTEITITPVINPIPANSTSQTNSLVQVDDVDEDTSLIDDRDSRLGSGARDNRDERDSPPRCQGCQERAAQFVCAGCGNQWYCSRDCQVAAWDEHSEVCSG